MMKSHMETGHRIVMQVAANTRKILMKILNNGQIFYLFITILLSYYYYPYLHYICLKSHNYSCMWNRFWQRANTFKMRWIKIVAIKYWTNTDKRLKKYWGNADNTGWILNPPTTIPVLSGLHRILCCLWQGSKFGAILYVPDWWFLHFCWYMCIVFSFIMSISMKYIIIFMNLETFVSGEWAV